jgi:hypothetical protein
MKINLFIEADPYASLYCEGWIPRRDNSPVAPHLRVKVGNHAIANLITGLMPCRVELSGRTILEGRIRKTDDQNDFIIESRGKL